MTVVAATNRDQVLADRDRRLARDRRFLRRGATEQQGDAGQNQRGAAAAKRCGCHV
jgi:hypothetical protein